MANYCFFFVNSDTKADKDSKYTDRSKNVRGKKERGGKNSFRRGGIIQTVGVFSEGTAVAPPRKSG